MSVKRVRILAVLLVCLAALGALTTDSHAEQGFTLTPLAIHSVNQVIATGGGASSGGAFTLRGTIGQPEAGVMTGGAFRLHGGFWAGEFQPTATQTPVPTAASPTPTPAATATATPTSAAGIGGSGASIYLPLMQQEE